MRPHLPARMRLQHAPSSKTPLAASCKNSEPKLSARTSPSAKLLWKDAGTYFYVPASGCSEVVQCETAEAAGGEPQQECAWCARGMRLLVLRLDSQSGKHRWLLRTFVDSNRCVCNGLGGTPTETLMRLRSSALAKQKHWPRKNTGHAKTHWPHKQTSTAT